MFDFNLHSQLSEHQVSHGAITTWAQQGAVVGELTTHSLEFVLLNKPTGIIVQDPENLLHLLGAFFGESTNLEKLLRAEGVWCWSSQGQHKTNFMNNDQAATDLLLFSVWSFTTELELKEMTNVWQVLLSVM